MGNRIPRWSFAVLVAALSGCGGGDSPPSSAEGAAPAADAWPGGFAFKVAVSLSEAARRKLSADGERIVVSVAYSGGPAPDVPPGVVNDVGLVDIGRDEGTLDGEGVVAFDGRAAHRDRLGMTQGESDVLVSVYSARRSSPDNILDCDTYQDEMRLASGRTLHLSCRLLSERE
ncbi:hypothetical protein [Pseudoxanthomonas putridarboris]|uniref:Lipoprotein n=1 Tax=Pseudoxanthomonas putridarboris TaxID=752605 RepID=A0ABU9J4S2_9GAMM